MSDFPELKRPYQPTFERALKDHENPKSLVNLVSPELRALIEALPPEYVDIPEEELARIFPDPTPTTMQVRRLFWTEFDRAIQVRQKMELTYCYTGACTRAGFHKMVQVPAQLAWILCPPKEYMIMVEDLLDRGLRQIGQILSLPLINSLGSVDTKLADVQLRAVMMLDQRMKGGYIQRSMQISHNVNENKTSYSVESSVDSPTPLSIDERIAQIQLEISHASKLTAPQVPEQMLISKQSTAIKREDIEEADFKEVEGG